MRLFRDRQMMLRIAAALADALLFYIGFLFVNNLTGGNRIHIIFFIITAFSGLSIRLLPYNDFNKKKTSNKYAYIGLTAAVASIILSSLNGFYLFAMLMGFIALLFLYYRTHTSSLDSVLYVYNVGNFYKSALFLFFINAIVRVWSGEFIPISDEVMRYTLLYIVMALYILSEVKSFKYVSKDENAPRTAFDITVTSILIALTLILSIPGVFNAVVTPFAAAFKFIYEWVVQGIVLITYPITWLMNYLFKSFEGSVISRSGKSMENMMEEYKKIKNPNSAASLKFFEVVGRGLTFLLMMAICALAIYLLFKFINRLTKKDEEEDFEESREFVLMNKQKAPGLISKLTGSMKKAIGNLAFMLTADNRDRLRYDYKNFIQKLHSKKLIEHYNYTARDIYQLILSKAPNQKNELSHITDMYEEVRYGTKYPEDSELKSFRKNIAEISRGFQQGQ